MSDLGNLDDFDPYDYGYSMYCPSYPEIEAFDFLPDMPVLCFEDVDDDDPDDSHVLFI